MLFKESFMGPRYYKTSIYSTKPCDDLSGPGPPIFQKKVETSFINAIIPFNNHLVQLSQ